MPSQDIKKQDEYTPAGKGSDYYMNNVDGKGTSMSASDQAALKAAGDAYNNATNDDERKAAHDAAEKIRAKYGYSGGDDGSEYIADAPKKQQSAPQQSYVPPAPDFTGLLDSWLESAKAQQEGKIDYATQQGIKELQRTEADAQEQFDAQEKQTNIEEAKALDNQALYAEARGDRGGIGQAQYAQIQAQAMQNRQAINSARTKLSTDVARQITDLRTQGEFQKADTLLQLAQTYLGQLIDLQKWGAEYSLSVAQFNAQLQQWQAEFEQEASRWQMEFDYTTSRDNQSILAASGSAALSVGVRPSKAQQAAMGYTDAQIDAELAAYKLAQSAGVKLPQSGIEPVGGTGLTGALVKLYKDKITNENDAYHALREAGYTAGDAERYAEEYMTRLEDGSLDAAANDAPKVNLNDIPSWVLTDIRERLLAEGGNTVTFGTRLTGHLQTLIDEKIITEDQAVRIGASFGLPY